MDNPIIQDPINIISSGINSSLSISPKVNTSGDFLYQWFYSSQTGAINPNIFQTVPTGTGVNLTLNIQNNNNHLYWYKLSIIDKNTDNEYLTEPMQLGILPTNLNITGIPLYVYANNGKANLQVLPSGLNHTYVWKQKTITHEEELDLTKYIQVASGVSNTLSLSGLGISNNYSIYNVTVSSGSNTWVSPPITLIYDPSITIIQENVTDFYLPETNGIDIANYAVGTAQLYVVAQSSNGILSYKWQKSTKGGPFEDIVGATKNLLNLSGLGVNDIGDKYRAVISSNLSRTNFKYSSVATILSQESSYNSVEILNMSPDIVYMTTNGAELYCEFTTYGTYAIAQWYQSTDQITWTAIGSSNLQPEGGIPYEVGLSIPFSSFQNKKEYYRCKITEQDLSTSLLSKIITVDYNPTTYVIANPTNLTTTNGSGNLSCQFFQNLTGVYDYAWYRLPISGTDIMEKSSFVTTTVRNGQFSPEYTSTIQLTGLSLANNDGDRYAFIGKTKDTQNVALISKQAYVTVPNTLTIATGLPDLIRIPVGQSGSLEVSVTTSIPGGVVNYQWSSSTNSGLSFSNIANATGNKLNIPTTASGDNNKYYRVTVNDSINTIILK